MNVRPFLIHALSPLHAGVGHADGIVDLPTARMKATGIPFVPGSSIKGVLRSQRAEEGQANNARHSAAFGPPTDNASEHAGALIVGDARLLALPVRSFVGTFAWVSSPLLLSLARRDLAEAASAGNGRLDVPKVEGRKALSTRSNICRHDGKLYLEDLDLPLEVNESVEHWAKLLAPHVYPDTPNDHELFAKRFTVIDDDTMTFFCETALQIDARVRLTAETRTVANGALWLEESLPPETLLIGLLAADRSRHKECPMSPDEVLDVALKGETVLQIGGHATIGRGRCRMIPLCVKNGGI